MTWSLCAHNLLWEEFLQLHYVKSNFHNRFDIMAKWLTHLLCIWDVPGSNLGPETHYTDWIFSWLSLSLRTNTIIYSIKYLYTVSGWHIYQITCLTFILETASRIHVVQKLFVNGNTKKLLSYAWNAFSTDKFQRLFTEWTIDKSCQYIYQMRVWTFVLKALQVEFMYFKDC